jgi:hypothetical protein
VQVTRATFIPLLSPGSADRLDPDAVTDDFCADLSVIYTFGPQFGRRVVTHTDLDQMQLPVPVLRRSAFEHLEVLSSRAEFHGQPPALMLSFEGLESSLVLASDFWTRLEGAVPGELVVGVPARDVVIVTGSQSGAGMEKVRRCVERVFFAGGDNPLSRSLLVRRGGAWEPFDRPRPAGARRGLGPAHQLGVSQPPRQYQEHNSWPDAAVRPVSGPSEVRRTRPPVHPAAAHAAAAHLAAHAMRPAANPGRPAVAPFGAAPGPRPVSMGGPLTNHGGPLTNHGGPLTNHGGPLTNHGGPLTNHGGPLTNHGGPLTNHGTGRGSAAQSGRPAQRPVDIAQRSAMPYSPVPQSAVPYSAMPYSAVPYSASPYPTSSASSFVPSPQLRSAPAPSQSYSPAHDRPSYDRPSHDKPAYDKPAYDKPAYDKGRYDYDEPAYDQPQYGDPKPSYREDRYSTGSQPRYDDTGSQARYGDTGSQSRYGDTGSQSRYGDRGPSESSAPEYPASWGWAPEQSASRPEWKASPRARFSSR